jgi:hypothetical protein
MQRRQEWRYPCWSSLFLRTRNISLCIASKPFALGILLSEFFKQTYKLCGKVSDIERTIISQWPLEYLVGNNYEIKNEQRDVCLHLDRC